MRQNALGTHWAKAQHHLHLQTTKVAFQGRMLFVPLLVVDNSSLHHRQEQDHFQD